MGTRNPDPMSDRGHVYADYIAGELRAEQARRLKVEDDGKAIITQTLSLLTAVLAVAGLVGAWGVDFSPTARNLIIATIVVLVLALIAGVLVGWKAKYEATECKVYDDMLEPSRWREEEADARHDVSVLNVKAIGPLRDLNTKKAWVVIGGHVLQVLGIVAAAATVVHLALY